MPRSPLTDALARLGPATVVERLRPYLTPARQARIDAVLAARLDSLQVALESPANPHNAAAVVRTCEAMGVIGVHAIAAASGALTSHDTTRGAYLWVDPREHRSLAAFLAWREREGLRLFGAAVDGERELHELPVDAPACVLLGNEHDGLSAAAKAACDLRFRIPMFGATESFNLSVSAALCLAELAPRRRVLLGAAGDLCSDRAMALRARHYAHSVDPRLMAVVLGRP